jgi:hypothetical protein
MQFKRGARVIEEDDIVCAVCLSGELFYLHDVSLCPMNECTYVRMYVRMYVCVCVCQLSFQSDIVWDLNL